MTTLVDGALACARRGWAVFPLSPRTKIPMPGTHGVKDATKDEARIRAWWFVAPDANIGLATGAVSGLFVFDVDVWDTKTNKPKLGLETLAALEREHGAIQAVIRIKTGSGGLQYVFSYAGPVKNSASKLGRHVDTKSDGGYVLAPPSIHPNGTAYEWLTSF